MQARRSALEIPDRMIDQEPTRFLSEIEGGMLIGPKTGTGSSEKPRYGIGRGSAEVIDKGAMLIEWGVFWGPGGTMQLLGAVFRGSRNFRDGFGRMFPSDGRREVFVGSEG